MAQITITIPDDQVNRVRAAFTKALDLKEPATPADIKNYVITDIKQLVRNTEKRVAQELATASVADVDLT